METDNQQQELAQLEQQLREAVAAEEFFERASGRLIVDIINRRVNIALRNITSDKFVKDHTGYVNELSWLKANQRLLKGLQIAKLPTRKAKIEERLEEYKNGPDAAQPLSE